MAKKIKKGPGRPPVVIDWDYFEELCQAQCNGASIAGILGIHKETLYDAVKRKYNMLFSDFLREKSKEGRELLRHKQFSQAMEGNTTMQIWLGKQYLGQSEKSDLTTGGEQFKGFGFNFLPSENQKTDDADKTPGINPESETA